MSAEKKPSALSLLEPKQAAFVREYVTDYNATQAAIRAGYSPPSARQIASAMLTKHDIKDAVSELEDARVTRSEVSDTRLLQELERLALYDAAKFWDEEGNLIPLDQLSPDQSAALAGMDVQERFEDGKLVGYTKRYKFAGKAEPLKLLLQMRGRLKERVELSYDLSNLTIEELQTFAALQSKIVPKG